MNLVEISDFIGQSLSKKFIVIFRGGNILGEDCFLVESYICILWIEPIMVALMLHNFKYPTSVDFSNILIMQVFVESSIKLLISLFPLSHIFLQSPGISKNLFSKITLILEMHFSHCLFMILQIFILYLL